MELDVIGKKRSATAAFGDGDGDAEEAATPAKAPALAPGANAGAAKQDVFNESYLKYYYANFMPYQLMFRWLSYGNDPDRVSTAGLRGKLDYFKRREFSFTLAGDVYIRYQSFRDASEFERAVTSRQPHKIDIGPVFSADPAKHLQLSKEKFAPTERELIFDIDLTDYDDVRTCCTGANICASCWSYMGAAIRILNAALREDFGFRQIMFVYSGRRGVHCWVCDPQARELSNAGRAAIVEYLNHLGEAAGKAGEGVVKGVTLGKVLAALSWPLHPSHKRAESILLDVFKNKVIVAPEDGGQGLLSSPKHWQRVLDMIPDLPDSIGDLRGEMRAYFLRPVTPAKRWATFCKSLANAVSRLVQMKPRLSDLEEVLRKLPCAIVFVFSYPRLDVHVSMQMNHLLKSPFCVHPATGRVCVPINPDDAEAFDPRGVPTVAELTNEGDSIRRRDPSLFAPASGACAGGAGTSAAADEDGVGGGAGGAAGGGGRAGGAAVVVGTAATAAASKAAGAQRRFDRMHALGQRTRMKPYLDLFESFVTDCEGAARQAEAAAKARQQEAAQVVGDW